VGPLSGLRAYADFFKTERFSIKKGRQTLDNLVAVARIIQRYATNFAYGAREGEYIFSREDEFYEDFNHDELIEYLIDISKLFQGLAAEKGIKKVGVNVGSFLEFPVVSLNKHWFEIALMNILDNAVKYSFDGAPIEITGACPTDGFVEFHIVSHGIELAEKDIGIIFQRFRRTKVAIQHTPAGTGIGLYLSHQIAQLHKGTLTALPSTRSIHGNRVEFIFRFPVRGDNGVYDA